VRPASNEADVNQQLEITVNKEEYQLNVPVNRTLLHFLKEDLGLIGTKDGCRQGVCGSCTVLVDGTPIRSCLALAIRYRGKSITTVEGLKDGDRLHPLQQAFIAAGALQCGYCTPGMLMMAASLLKENPEPTEADVRKALIGNICRCTGYSGIVQAILDVSARPEPSPVSTS
jgi:aerobic carbon-monoxide dehydrogenase small subunit